jgi:chemotaxis protein MotA
MQWLAGVVRFLDPVSLGLVFGGALLSAAFRSTRGDLAAAGRALAALVRADPVAEAAAARAAVIRIERTAELRSRAYVDRLDHGQRFVAAAAQAVAEAADPAAFARWATEEAEGLAARHGRAIGFWRAVADAAPAMGMLGTIVGLSAMFAAMDDVASLGPAMAVAMLTTFHGVLLSAGIAGPVAARLERLSAAEREWRDWTCRRLAGLVAEPAVAATPEPRNGRLRLVK